MNIRNNYFKLNHLDENSLSESIWTFKLKSFALAAAITSGFALFSFLIGGFAGIVIMLSFVVIMLISSIMNNSTQETRQGVFIHPAQAPGLYNDLQLISRRAGLVRLPELYILPYNFEMTAFTTSRGERDMIFFSRGLLEGMDRDEIRGVMAHEVAHIASGDLILMGFMRMTVSIFNTAAGIFQAAILIILLLTAAGLINLSILFILLMFFGPPVSILALLALSRLREYHADAVASALTGDPVSLARALKRISMMELNPFRFFRFFRVRHHETIPEHFRTHPVTEKRIAKLLQYRQKLYRL